VVEFFPNRHETLDSNSKTERESNEGGEEEGRRGRGREKKGEKRGRKRYLQAIYPSKDSIPSRYTDQPDRQLDTQHTETGC
jgi:hypothetical protein